MTGIHPIDTTNTSNHLSTSASLITLPIPSPHAPTYLVAHITHFKGQSLMIWCGETNPMLADSALQTQRQTSNESQQNESSLLLEAESVTPASQQPSIKASDSIPPIGVLGKEWAVGMTNSLTDSSISTSLFRSNLDISKPMAARLCRCTKKFFFHLFLSFCITKLTSLHLSFHNSKTIQNSTAISFTCVARSIIVYARWSLLGSFRRKSATLVGRCAGQGDQKQFRRTRAGSIEDKCI